MTKPPPDRWLAVGGALAAAGTALAVGYWIYGMQASPHVNFWHWPGYLGYALLALGVVALAIGFLGRDPGSSPKVRQSQHGGDHSTQIQSGRTQRSGEMTDQSQKVGADNRQYQAGGDITIGVTAEEVVNITRAEVARSVDQLTAAAKEVAEARNQALGDRIIGAFEGRPELFQAFADPDFQFSLRDAARAAASTDDEHTEQLLVDLLTNRAEEGSSTRVRLATSQAIRAADKLSKDALVGLTAIWAISYLSSRDGTFGEKLESESETATTLIALDLPSDNAWVSDLDVLNLARVQSMVRRNQYIDVLAQHFAEFLVPGIDKEADRELLDDAKRTVPEVDQLVSDHPLKPGFVRLTPVDSEAVLASLPVGAADIEVVMQVIGKNGYGGRDNTAQANLAKAVAEAEPLTTIRDWWQKTPAFDLTVAGDVIGFVNARRHLTIANATSIADLLRLRSQ